MRKIWGGVLVLTGIIACPCHLPLTLALLAGVLGGTALGSFVANHQGLIYGIAVGYFIVAIAVGYHFLTRKRKSATPLGGNAETQPVAGSNARGPR